jgi:hypothetical protein
VVAARRRFSDRCGAGGPGNHGGVDTHDREQVDADHDTDDAVPTWPAGALANLSEVITAGERQGTIDPAAEDLLSKAEDVVRAVQEGMATTWPTSSRSWSERLADRDRAAVTSLTAAQTHPARLADLLRSHWAIEICQAGCAYGM